MRFTPSTKTLLGFQNRPRISTGIDENSKWPVEQCGFYLIEAHSLFHNTELSEEIADSGSIVSELLGHVGRPRGAEETDR